MGGRGSGGAVSERNTSLVSGKMRDREGISREKMAEKSAGNERFAGARGVRERP